MLLITCKLNKKNDRLGPNRMIFYTEWFSISHKEYLTTLHNEIIRVSPHLLCDSRHNRTRTQIYLKFRGSFQKLIYDKVAATRNNACKNIRANKAQCKVYLLNKSMLKWCHSSVIFITGLLIKIEHWHQSIFFLNEYDMGSTTQFVFLIRFWRESKLNSCR